MKRLPALERDFQHYVVARDPSVVSAIESSVTLDATARLDVYADAYRLRLIEVLGKDFPGLRRIAGDTRFESLARDYVESTPSRHFNIRWYGASLPGHLRQLPDGADRELLAEMAQYEWAMGLAFDAPDEACVGPAEIGAVAPAAWPDMRLVLVQSLHLLEMHWNVPALRKAVDEQAELPVAQRESEAAGWMVWRRELGVRYRRLERDEALALDLVRHGTDFAGLCEHLGETAGEHNAALLAAAMLKRWIQDGLISRIETDAAAPDLAP